MNVSDLLRQSDEFFAQGERLLPDDTQYQQASANFLESNRLREQAGTRDRLNGICLLKAASAYKYPYGDQVEWKRRILRLAMELLQDDRDKLFLADCYNEMGKTYLPRALGDTQQDYTTGVATFQVARDLYQATGVETTGRVEALRGLGVCLHYLGQGECRWWYSHALEMSRRVHGEVCWETFEIARLLMTSWPPACLVDKMAAAKVMWEAFPYKGEAEAVAKWWGAYLRPLPGGDANNYPAEGVVQRFEAALARKIADGMWQPQHSITIGYDPSDAVLDCMELVGIEPRHQHVPCKSGTEIVPGKATARLGRDVTVIFPAA